MNFRRYNKVFGGKRRHVGTALLLCFAIVTSLSAPPALAADYRPATIPPIGQDGEQDTIFLPLVQSNTCPATRARRPSTVFGVQMYTNTAATVRYFDPLMDLNATWVRSQVEWARAEPDNVEPADFDWRFADRALAVAAEGGMNVIATITFNPDWASPHHEGPINEESLDDFAQFLSAMVERYDGDGIDDDPCGRVVKHWEFYNEPDGGSKPNDVRWGEYGAKYAEMLQVAYGAVKGADADGKVLFGGMAYDWFTDQTPPGPFVRSFLTDVLDAGGGDYFDYMNFHVYPAFAPNWTSSPSDGPGLYEKALAIQAVMQSYGLDKPMVITEAGAHSNADGTSPSTPAIQSSYVVQLYTQSLAADIDVMIWFMLYDPPEWYPNKNGLMDLSTPPVLKPAYSTYQRTATKLANVRFDRVLTDEEMGSSEMLGYRFVDPATGHPLYVVWMAPVRTTSRATLELPGRQAQVLHIDGTTQEVRANDDGRLAIDVDNEPIIIEVTAE